MNVRKLSLTIASTAIALTSFAGSASAQTFPADDRWSPLPCGAGVMVDGFQDQAGARDERDIVGDPITAAGYRAADDKFVYLRLRLEKDPAPGKSPKPFEWGFELDLDGVRSTYELLVILRGTDATIAVHRNTTTTLADDPADPADDPPVATFPFATHGRSMVAAVSRYGSDDDYFLDLAIPWTTLEPLGVTRTAPLAVWAATSTKASSLDGDFACHDGGSGAPKLSAIAPPPTTLDPAVDTDKDGWTDAVEVTAGTDPKNAGSHPAGTPPPAGGASEIALEGAGGCKCSWRPTGDASFASASLVAVVALVARRRRRP